MTDIIQQIRDLIRPVHTVEGSDGQLCIVPKDHKLLEVIGRDDLGDHINQNFHAQTVGSLADYVNSYREVGTTVFVNQDDHRFSASIDYHRRAVEDPEDVDGEPQYITLSTRARVRHNRHLAVFEPQKDRRWLFWVENNDAPMDQLEFIRLLEDHRLDVKQPDGATLMELVQTFESHQTINFRSHTRLSDGRASFEYVTQKDDTKRQVTLPEEIILEVPIFRQSKPVRVRALLRHRIASGSLRLWYTLVNPDDLVDEAFGMMVGELYDTIADGIPILDGWVSER